MVSLQNHINAMLGMLNGEKVKRSISLHSYQNDFVSSVEKSWKDGHQKTLAVAPVGSGKTVMAGELIAKEIERGGRVLVLAHTIDLVAQFRASLENNYGLWVSMDGGGQSSEDSPVVVSTIQSLAGRMGTKFQPDAWTLIVVDEAHRILGDLYRKCLEFFNMSRVLAITATPVRSDQKCLMTVLDNKAFDIPITDLIQQGYLSNIVIQNIPITFELESKASSKGDYKEEEVGEAVAPMLEPCAKAYAQHSQGKCGAIFLPLVSLSQKFCDLLCDLGVRAIHVDGSLSARERVEAKRKVEMGEAECFCCSLLWSEGFDLRPLNLLMNLRASKSWTLQTQIIGRITRVFDPLIHGPKGTRWPKKTEATILDPLWHVDNYNMLQRPASFIAKDEEELESIERHIKKRQQAGKGADLLAARSDAIAEKEEKIRQRLKAMQQRKERTIDAVELFTNSGHMELVGYEEMARWELEKPSEKQIEFLTRQKVNIGPDLTKGKASKMIDIFMERINRGLASGGQIKFMQGLGMTEEEAWKMSFEGAKQWLDKNAPPKPSWQKKY